MGELQFTIEHRAGSKHTNTGSLSRQTCFDCKKCKSIEQRDGGPTRQELEAELALEGSEPTASSNTDNVATGPDVTGQVVYTNTFGSGDIKDLVAAQQWDRQMCLPSMSSYSKAYQYQQFESNLVKELCALLGVEKSRASVF